VDPQQLAAACAALPVFPLPRLVLMPRDTLPLHIFEPRYRQLIAHSLSTNKLLGLATLRPGPTDEMHPPIYPTVAIAEIIEHFALPDGRSHIVVQWLAHGEIETELPSDYLFRLFKTRVFSAAQHEPPIFALRQLVLQLGAYTDEAADEAKRLSQLPGSELVDFLARRVFEDTDARLEYVSQETPEARAQLVEERLAELIRSSREPMGDA